MNFEAVIGLEIHVEMKTKSKMFSSAPINFSDEPNTDTTYLDFAFPGTMPVVNKEAVRKAIQMCNALHMEIDDELWFDRKNYFYSDLPKGYQITQQARPIGKNGYLEIEIDGEKRKIGIERLHMEEDTCKQTHFNDYTLLDYNRAGIPLIEIVSLPVMHTGLEARKYVEKIREFVTFSGVSDGKMEEGSLRCDVNISLRPYGSDKFGTKVEIKNLNSIANIEKAIDYEILRQSRLLFKGEDIIQETRRFDEAKKETILMRVKTDAVDYKYFTEPNITPIKLSKEFIIDAINSCPELYDSKLNRFLNDYKLERVDAEILLNNVSLADFFEEICKYSKYYISISKFVITDILGYLNKSNLEIKDFKVESKYIAELIDLLQNKEVNSSQGKEIFNHLIKENRSPIKIKEELGFTVISDDSVIRNIVTGIISKDPSLVTSFKNGKTRVQGFIMGQVMKELKGKANPVLANKIILEELNK